MIGKAKCVMFQFRNGDLSVNVEEIRPGWRCKTKSKQVEETLVCMRRSVHSKEVITQN